jgi:hypothetical protein
VGRTQQQQAADDGTRHPQDKIMAEAVGSIWVQRLAAGGSGWWRSRAMKKVWGRESHFLPWMANYLRHACASTLFFVPTLFSSVEQKSVPEHLFGSQ